MRKVLLAIALLVAAVALFAAARIGPRNIVGMLRYDHRRDGDRRVGELAPDVELVGLGGTPAKLSSVIGRRPLVLVLGSYT